MSPAKYPEQIKSSKSQKQSNNKINWSNTNPKQIFDLIDNILPFTDCLSYQLIPLSLKNKHLVLGLVNINNVNAVARVRSICLNKVDSISTKPLDVKTHQLILSAYSRRSNLPKQEVGRSPSMLQERPTLILDNPEELQERSEKVKFRLNDSFTSQPPPTPKFDEKQSVQQSLNLDLQPKYMSAPPKFLASLPPQLLWKELVARIVVSGNGRIQLEKLPNNGRITWSQNGNLKLSLDSVSNSTFLGILKELKQLVDLPTTAVLEVHKGELERYYQQERLLLLWRINPGRHGEEATIQVIRGKVLDLYQKRQMEELGNQAIEIAKQLERKLEQIHTCRRINSNTWKEVSTLHKLQAKINQKIKLLD